MNHKSYIYVMTGMLLLGCGEDFSVGVSKGGTGNGKPKDQPIEYVGNEVLARNYFLQLSAPVADECQGLNRGLKFIQPLDQSEINQDTALSINTDNMPDSQIVAQLVWHNSSNQIIDVFAPVCYEPFILRTDEHQFYPQDARCDTHLKVSLAPNEVYISHFNYNFRQTVQGQLSESSDVIFSTKVPSGEKCKHLSLKFKIYNQQ